MPRGFRGEKRPADVIGAAVKECGSRLARKLGNSKPIAPRAPQLYWEARGGKARAAQMNARAAS
jgi:hypothetical protein